MVLGLPFWWVFWLGFYRPLHLKNLATCNSRGSTVALAALYPPDWVGRMTRAYNTTTATTTTVKRLIGSLLCEK